MKAQARTAGVYARLDRVAPAWGGTAVIGGIRIIHRPPRVSATAIG